MVFANFTNDNLHSTGNVSDPVAGRRCTRTGISIRRIGGPLKTEKLWFFGSYRYWGSASTRRAPITTPIRSTSLYVPDLSRPAVNETTNQSYDVRLTWQAAEAQVLVLGRRKAALLVPLVLCVDRLTGRERREPHRSQSGGAGYLERTDHQQAADRRRLYLSCRVVGVLATAVLCRRHLSLTELSTNVNFRARAPTTARTAASHQRQVQRLVRHRLARLQGRLSGHARPAAARHVDARVRRSPSACSTACHPRSTQFTYPYTTKANVKWYMGRSRRISGR